ncbi:MAG: hypothetical protein COZ06_07110 [Armatimonadetes bacterium CG_4_10_14_3_um_filter_66_18]|nr:MAG: hypothetical protein COS65_20285 [Armatimonadetes bacterium CG06_land_8_20_14_3_00_66_21]PIX47620.1 MAG: hypothetical protein COZ57_08135 [Armatimonadetes bacterium CG_4_8_14_3_um_filter_66_20]PIY50860.1 MAG: hypothetical protein COZ06_07110 [Armatimonadetes bacterium CG_4_10_14_3_um_filter_66_18]PIZ29625.1 MAG: hypothetical protein COY42_35140 [Armatimonadetes bacterium CG_4_10_14_0_8_um_filter_66_14]PJB72329.1 MAG: hypothetical protein CO096_07925 [Armatimonadetes bacterium CG_4_9_14_
MSMADETIRLKPHHFLDLLRDLGAGRSFSSPPGYGHAVPQVAAALQANPDVLLELTAGIDDICAPCTHNVNGACDDLIGRYDPPVSKDEYNRRLDERWCERLGLGEGHRMTARAFCLLASAKMGDLRTIYLERGEAETQARQEEVLRGVEVFLALPRR